MGMSRARSWDDVAAYAERRLAPTFGQAASASGLALHPTDDVVAASAEVRPSLLEPSKAVITRFSGGRAEEVREGWLPTWSSEGVLAHVDGTGVQVGEWHLALTGRVERLTWSADGRRLLAVVADTGSEVPNLAGSGLVPHGDDEAWLPHVASTDEHPHWRRLLVLDAATGTSTPVGRADLNVWSACWAGADVFALCSDGDPTESAWYAADLRLLDVITGEDRVVATPAAQVGVLTASPSGSLLAYVESVCSDRDLVAGDLTLLDPASGETRRLAAPVDVSDAAFVSEQELGFVGLEGLTTHTGFVRATGEVRFLWSSSDATAAGVLPTAAFRDTRIALLSVGHRAVPELIVVTDGGPAVVAALPAMTPLAGTSAIHRWKAPDGVEVEGWLHRPEGDGPHPLVVLVHGGPIMAYHAAPVGLLAALLLERGYAVLMPNPRGSSGRGQEFARAVVGDMGGADAVDITSGVSSLVDLGVADAARIGITGGSYGGYLTAWLVTQSSAFAAAVAQHPVTDWAHQHGVSNIPYWDELFLDGKPYATDGQYVERSPLTHAAKVVTPTLFITGTLDRATPPGQSLAMHRALASYGVTSACLTYPTAAHGPRDIASAIDVTARTLEWFERFMPAAPLTGAK